MSGQEARSAATAPPFDRWTQESGVWQGEDYLWVNRYRDLWQAYREAQREIERLRDELQRARRKEAFFISRGAA